MCLCLVPRLSNTFLDIICATAKQATAVKTKACDLFARQLAWEAMEVMPALRNTLTEDALLAAIMNQDSPLFLVRDFDSDQDVDEKKRNLPVANSE